MFKTTQISFKHKHLNWCNFPNILKEIIMMVALKNLHQNINYQTRIPSVSKMAFVFSGDFMSHEYYLEEYVRLLHIFKTSWFISIMHSLHMSLTFLRELVIFSSRGRMVKMDFNWILILKLLADIWGMKSWVDQNHILL